MVACNKAPERHCKSITAVRLVSVSFIKDLSENELLTGVPAVEEFETSDLTLTNKVVNTNTVEINGVDNLPGQAVQFLVAGGSVNTYEIDIDVSTDSSPAQTLDGTVELEVTLR